MSLLVPPRRPSREMLDEASLPSEEMARSLQDLELVNASWRSAGALADSLVPGMKSGGLARYTLLDVGAGSGGVSRSLARRLDRKGLRATVVAVDLQWRHLAAGAAARSGGVTAAAADAFALPFGARSVDWVVSTLFFHHFSPEQNVRLLRELARVARRGFTLLDLRRHLVPLILVSVAGRLVFRSPVSLADGAASVRQAYTLEEARRIAAEAVPGARVERRFPYRLVISGPGT